jgi:ubiquinone/menaquinone biosynthesis C-methylase UbiE
VTGSIERNADEVAGPQRRPTGADESRRASRDWWEAEADAYQEEHGAFLGDARFVWGPEGLDEATARLLGPVEGRAVLEVGAGAAQCARWLIGHGGRAVGLDLSYAQLTHSRRLDVVAGVQVPVVQADACALPFASASFDLACSAYGAVPFVADVGILHREVARVLRPGGRWVFSVTHPVRWAFPDVPGRSGLKVTHSYFDRTPYIETDEGGAVAYVEHHRTLGDQIRALATAGFAVLDVVEPEWPPDHQQVWGGWSPLRGRLIPGTAVYVAELAGGRAID